MKTIVTNSDELYTRAALRIAEQLREKPETVLALCAGRTMEPLFRALAGLYGEGKVSLSGAKVFAVTEYEGIPPDQSCRCAIEKGLVGPTDLKPENCRFLCEENWQDYDRLIEEAGGLDLAVLGIGDNGHIGYNEPATPYDSRTHRQKLTDATRRQNAAVFGSEEAVPEYAWTMGIKTLVSARHILVRAAGEEKTQPVFKMLYARDDSVVPAAFLQLPMNVEVYVDPAAAAKL